MHRFRSNNKKRYTKKEIDENVAIDEVGIKRVDLKINLSVYKRIHIELNMR